jgi:hypothetical protein
MDTQYITTSLTNWSIDKSLGQSLSSSYFNRLHTESEIFVANNAKVSFVGQLAMEPKPEFEDEIFAIKLRVVENKLSSSEKMRLEKICDMLLELGFDNNAYEILELTKQTVEVYAASARGSSCLPYTNHSEFLGKFNVTGNNIEDVEDCLWNIEGVENILNMKEENNND